MKIPFVFLVFTKEIFVCYYFSFLSISETAIKYVQKRLTKHNASNHNTRINEIIDMATKNPDHLHINIFDEGKTMKEPE